MKNLQVNKNQEMIFPGGTGLAILKLLEKYGLKETHEAAIKKLTAAKSYKEKVEAAEDLPGRKIARIVKEVAEGKITKTNFPLELQKGLNLSKEKVKDLARDLESEVLIFAKRVAVEVEEEAPLIKPFKKSGELIIPPIEKKLEEELEEKPKRTSGKDTYRETIE